jgi:SpoVK/Ycf46/Vps4 family AAA+-type ATPase
MRPRVSALLSGPSGTGKTLTIKGFLHEFVRMLRERTGLDTFPSRVVRAKTSELLSEWLGRSDKNIDELFDDVYDIVSKPVTTANGEKTVLPCVLVLEEAEGFGRRRGQDHEGVYDRIIGTFLQRLDDPTQDLSKFPLIILATSNRPDLFDAAVWRRLSGVVAPFGRLDEAAFKSVLEKKLKSHFPYSVDGENKRAKSTNLRDIVVQHTTDEFYNNGDEPVLSLVMDDGRTVERHVRHFMTGAVLEQTVSNIIDGLAVEYEKSGGKKRLSISEKMVCNGIRHYIGTVVKNLTPQNAGEYLDVPEESRITGLKLRA